MAIKNVLNKYAGKAADTVANLAALSPEQLEQVQAKREKYLSELPDPNDATAQELTKRLLAAGGVEIYNAYLENLNTLYKPMEIGAEYDGDFKENYNIRYINISRWVTDKQENSLEKLVNVYDVLSNEDCNIALVFNRTCEKTNVYLAVVNVKNSNNNSYVECYKNRLVEAIKGNFPGAKIDEKGAKGVIPCFKEDKDYSVAITSNIPAEKSEKFVSQTIEKLLDGIVPDCPEKEYTIVLLATPITNIEERKLHLAELYSGLAPYSTWTTNFTYQESDSTNSMASVGINVGASAGIQAGQNSSNTKTLGNTDSSNKTETDTKNGTLTETDGKSISKNKTHSSGINKSTTKAKGTNHGVNTSIFESVTAEVGGGILPAKAKVSAGGSVGVSKGWNESTSITSGKSVSDAVTDGVTDSRSHSVANSIGKSLANSLGKAVSNSVSKTAGVFKSNSFGVNFGASFARSSSVTATVGKNEGITQTFTNYNIKHALELLESQMKRYELCTALGMWDFAAYVVSEDLDVANNVAHFYLALTQGEESYLSHASTNLWRGDVEGENDDAKEIFKYIRQFRHPLFALNPSVIDEEPDYLVYPTIVTATTSLSGKELAYSLNFPQKSISGLPVIECTTFGRNIVSYNNNKNDVCINLGHIFHMNHPEKNTVELKKQSLASHTFITGSTGSGKSNTVYKLLSEAVNHDIKFLVVEPAKGEYKTVFGKEKDVFVYGTNPNLTPLLRINPFSFPKDIHVLEHMDRLIEIFNVCWPMYAAMPAVLKSAIEKSYEDCGWNLIHSSNKYGEKLYPTFSDVVKNIKEIIDSSEYDSDNKGAYKGSLITRLQSLSNGINGLIFSTDEIPASDLFDKKVIVDLSRVGSTETKTLIMGMLVLKLQEYRMVSAYGINEKIKHITVLEEAHNLLRKTSSEQSVESSNLVGKSVEMLSNAIAEMRTYGEGFIIVDQAPGLMDMSVIRNTNTKIIMRLPDQSDRELVGKAANLNDEQIKELAKLPCGVAAVYQNEWIEPVLCQIPEIAVNSTPYGYIPNEDEFLKITELASESLLDCIMNKELFGKGRKVDLYKLRGLIIKSKLNTDVKKDFLEYINSDKHSVEDLRVLVYDFFEADKTLKELQTINDVEMWTKSIVDKLQPSIKGYSTKQIDLVIALILCEQSMRDSTYIDLYSRFTDLYKAREGVS